MVLPLVKQYAQMGTIVYPIEELAQKIDHIIREEASKPVMAVQKLHDEMETSLSEKLGIPIRHKKSQENGYQRRIKLANAARKPVGSIISITGKGWGYGTSGVAGYHRDPQTSKIVWDDLPTEYQFRKRADLSTRVWKSVEQQEQSVFDVIQGGTAAGRDVKSICTDLETFINYKDGGERVVGRWMGMFPNTEAGRQEGWKRQYLEEHGGLQPGSDAAKALLRQPDAKQWVAQKMAETTKRGTPRLPPSVQAYAKRLGSAGLDYNAIRIARTETVAMVADEQVAIAMNSDICTGEMDFVMDRGRDHWNCSCEDYAQQNPWQVDDPDRPEIPVHPNCMCSWRPQLKTDEEIMSSLKEEMKDDLAIIQGTPEQQDLSSWIDDRIEIYSNNPYNDTIYKFLESQNSQNQAEYAQALDKIHSMMKDSESVWADNITEENSYGIESYTADDYTDMNLYQLGLLKDDGLSDLEDIKYKCDECASALSKSTLNEDIIAWKGVESEYYDNYEVGKVISYPAFHSSSIDFNSATDAQAKDMIIQFRIPKGTQGAYVANTFGIKSEDEFTIQRGLNYEVIDRGNIIHRGKDKKFMILQIVK